MLAIRIADNTAIAINSKEMAASRANGSGCIARVFTPVRHVNNILRGSLTPYGM